MGMAKPAGGASAADKGKDLRQGAAAARASRQAGGKVVRGKSETALKKQAKAWDAGAVGEGRTQRALDRLKREKDWTVLHDVLLAPPKLWNLDHVVVGTSGAFFIDAKNWRGEISVYKGQVWRHWYAGPKSGRQSANMMAEVRKVKGMAAHASERLGVRVKPVICLAGAKSREFTEIATVEGVVIISVDKVFPFLRDAKVCWGTVDARRVGERAAKVFPPATVQEPSEAEGWAQAMREAKPTFSTGAPPAASAGPPQTPEPAPQGGLLRRLRGR